MGHEVGGHGLDVEAPAARQGGPVGPGGLGGPRQRGRRRVGRGWWRRRAVDERHVDEAARVRRLGEASLPRRRRPGGAGIRRRRLVARQRAGAHLNSQGRI